MKLLTLLLFTCLICPLGYTQTDASVITELDDFVPVPAEDPYADENFMYFERNFLLTLGTGASIWNGSGNIGKLFAPSMPDINLGFRTFGILGGIYSALGVSGSRTNHPGKNIPMNLRTLRLDVGMYHYASGDGRLEALANNGFMNPISPSGYFVWGLSYMNVEAEYTKVKRTTNVPFYSPFIGLGLDFLLKPKRTSIGVEARYLPYAFITKNTTVPEPDFVSDELPSIIIENQFQLIITSNFMF